VLGPGDHVVKRSEDDKNYLHIKCPVNIVGSPKVLDKSKIVVVGGFYITANGAHVEHLTIRHKKGYGVYGKSSCTLTDLMIDQCVYGVFADGSDVVLNCTNIMVSKSIYSGVVAYDGGTIILRGNRTLITDNCLDGDSWHYGLDVSGPSSKIQIVSPLTAISKGNKGGGNWGGRGKIETIISEFNEQFFEACGEGKIKLVTSRLNDHPEIINKSDKYGRTPLYIACENGHLDIVNVLLQSKNIQINQPTNKGRTPLFKACLNGHLDIVRVLLASTAIEINQPDRRGRTPLIVASHEGHLDIVNVLLQSNKIEINQPNRRGRTPLYIASHEGHLDIVNVLLQSSKIEINQSNNNGATPLFIACQNGHLNVVKALLTDFGRHNTTKWGYCTLESNYKYIFDDMPTDISQKLTDLYTKGSLISEIERKDGFFHMKKRVKEGETAFLGIPDDFWKGTIPDVITLTLFGLARLTPDEFRKFPDEDKTFETFELHKNDTFTLDHIKCPVRCLPCKHVYEAKTLQRWFKTSIPGYNRNHTNCMICRQEPESIEMMTEIQVKRWNAMAAMEDNADKDLNRIRKEDDKYEPLNKKNAKLREEEQKISEVNKEIQGFNEEIQRLIEKKNKLREKKNKLREKKDKLWQAKTKTETEVSKLNESLPHYNTYVKTRKEATDAQAKNKLTNRFKDSTTLKF
jgi:ankyrin repeat protein/uncharacterized protein YoxC